MVLRYSNGAVCDRVKYIVAIRSAIVIVRGRCGLDERTHCVLIVRRARRVLILLSMKILCLLVS